MRKIFFDSNDYRLLEILNDVLAREVDRGQLKTLLTPYLRPHGIKELAASSGLRIAYATVHLLDSLKSDQADERINALAALRDEVFTNTSGNLRLNRARVLIQITKELIRAKGNPEKQLRLAHDFRAIASGRPHFLRAQLKKYHLLEMPEEWNQLSFDDRVHDANSKGRKSATHLIMDAWVKGIRKLTVVYYNHVDADVVSELFTAANILDIHVRVGIEFRAVHRGRFVKFIWSPSRLQDRNDIEAFFNRTDVESLMQDGQEAHQWHTTYVREITDVFNSVHRQSIEQELGILLPEISFEDLAKSAYCGQPSLLHLGKYIHQMAFPYFRRRADELKSEFPKATYDRQAEIAMHLESLDSLDADTIIDRYLEPNVNPDLHDPDVPASPEEMPSLLRLSPKGLASRLHHISHSSKLTLILADLTMADVLEILYDCQGRVNFFETFNVKGMRFPQYTEKIPFNELQRALNLQNAVKLKRIIRDCIELVSQSDWRDAASRVSKLTAILNDFDLLRSFYKHSSLKTSIGSGSTGQSSRNIGMGFAVRETLPGRAQRELRGRGDCIPAAASISQQVEYDPPRHGTGRWRKALIGFSRLPVFRSLLCRVSNRWHITDFEITERQCGNVVTLGGINPDERNGLGFEDEKTSEKKRLSLRYLNRNIANMLKVILGFIPAFLTFYLTKDWWVLAYLGGVIWFGITGLRNIIQSVMGGGGLHRSPYLRWKAYISWDRIADSLLYTGFSVPLLDWVCKTLILKNALGVDTTSAPLLLYATMALTNGVYLTGNNLFRGLPRSAAFANFFRSILSIPIAVLFNMGLGVILSLAGNTHVDVTLQLWAAVISKMASDSVAGVIEGLADRRQNIIKRRWDYSEKLGQVFEVFSNLEVVYPHRDMLETMSDPKEFLKFARKEDPSMISVVIANALDLLYFRYYQPRAVEVLQEHICSMTDDERKIFFASQYVLSAEKDVARLFVDGLVGRNFTKALSFYLLRHRDYLADLKKRQQYCPR